MVPSPNKSSTCLDCYRGVPRDVAYQINYHGRLVDAGTCTLGAILKLPLTSSLPRFFTYDPPSDCVFGLVTQPVPPLENKFRRSCWTGGELNIIGAHGITRFQIAEQDGARRVFDTARGVDDGFRPSGVAFLTSG